MAQLVVRHLEDEVKARLQKRATRHGRSMEDEVRDILRVATKDDSKGVRRLGSAMAARFRTVGLTEDLPELRGDGPRSMKIGR
jgi:plasmid stability protein